MKKFLTVLALISTSAMATDSNKWDTPMFSEGNNFLTVNIRYLFTKTERRPLKSHFPLSRWI